MNKTIKRAASALRCILSIVNAVLICKLLYEHQKHITDLEDEMDKLASEKQRKKPYYHLSMTKKNKPAPVIVDTRKPETELVSDIKTELLRVLHAKPDTDGNICFIDSRRQNLLICDMSVKNCNRCSLQIEITSHCWNTTASAVMKDNIVENMLDEIAKKVAIFAVSVMDGVSTNELMAKLFVDQEQLEPADIDAERDRNKVKIGKTSDETANHIMTLFRNVLNNAAYPHRHVTFTDSNGTPRATVHVSRHHEAPGDVTLSAYVTKSDDPDKSYHACTGVRPHSVILSAAAAANIVQELCEPYL